MHLCGQEQNKQTKKKVTHPQSFTALDVCVCTATNGGETAESELQCCNKAAASIISGCRADFTAQRRAAARLPSLQRVEVALLGRINKVLAEIKIGPEAVCTIVQGNGNIPSNS